MTKATRKHNQYIAAIMRPRSEEEKKIAEQQLQERERKEYTMTTLHSWDLDNPNSGPVEKFYLLKVYGAELRKAGYRTDDLKTFSCDDLRKAIAGMSSN
jgi:hypothetical protein